MSLNVLSLFDGMSCGMLANLQEIAGKITKIY